MATALHHGSIRIAIAAAHPVVRAGLRYIFDSHRHLMIVGEASAAGEALSLSARTQPDVLVIDPDSDKVPLQAIADLSEAGGGRLLVLTASSEAKLHHRAFELGAVGVVRKDQSAEILVQAVERVHAGEIWLERVKTAELLVGLRRRDPDAARILSLTKREREVIALVGLGLKNPAIGERLFISEGTVRNHLTSILGKLELSDRFELAVYAFRHGLVEPEGRRPYSAASAPGGKGSRAVAGRGS